MPEEASGDGRAAEASDGAAMVDCQCHWYPATFCEAQLRQAPDRWRYDDGAYVYEPFPGEVWRYTPEFYDLDVQFEIMDDAGVDILVCSPSILGDVSALELSEARDVALALNEEFAAAQRRHPDRFCGLAVVPTQDGEVAAEMLVDAVERLDLYGVLLHSNVAGRSIAEPQLRPLYATAERLGVPVFLHPTRAFTTGRVDDFALGPPLAYMFDTTVAAVSLILSGIVEDHPALRIVHPHLGGALPYLASRVDVYVDLGKVDFRGSLRDQISYFYTDTISESPEALELARATYHPERILFATDFPYFPAARGVEFTRGNVPAGELRAVAQTNAEALLGIEVVGRRVAGRAASGRVASGAGESG